MPSGLAGYIHGQSSNANPLNGKSLARRRAEVAGAKMHTKHIDAQVTTQSQPLPDRRTAPFPPSFSWSPKGNELDDEGLFGGSMLSDSDDTTRDLGSSNMARHQSIMPHQSSQDFGDRNGVEQELEREDEGEYGRNGEQFDYRSGMDDDGDYSVEDDRERHAAQFHLGNPLLGFLTTKKVLQFQESEEYAKARKLHHQQFGSSHMPSFSPVVSGRFTGVKELVDDVRQQSSGLGDTTEMIHQSRPQGNELKNSNNVSNYDGRENIRRQNAHREGQSHNVQAESTNRVSIAAEHKSIGRPHSGHGSHASEEERQNSEGPGDPSPSPHTPRANLRPIKQATTSNQREKRKVDALELDYDQTTLTTMKYSELMDQPFDSNPRALPSVNLGLLGNPDTSLEDQLGRIKSSDPENQSSFFGRMSLEQWEESGDWFLGQFGEILSKFKDARRAKRQVSKVFEDELTAREEVVRGKTEAIQDVFKKMRVGGEGVLREGTP